MNKLLVKTLIGLFVVFSFGFLSINSVWAGNNIVIEPSEGIFEVEKFFPGHSVSSEVRIKNESEVDYDKEIALGGERISELEDYDLVEVIILKIVKDGIGETEKTLVEILNGEELILPGGGIGAYEEKKYEFIATFNKGAGNKYANKYLEFDFLFFFRGLEEELDGEPEEVITVSGMSGTTFLPELTIDEERVRVVETGEDFVVIAWNTNLPAFGRVIYDTRSNQFNFIEGEPAYGYAFYTPKTEKQDTFHLITLTGLNPGTIYYYRVVSYGSLAIGREYSFITRGVKGWTIEEEEKAAEEKERIIEGVAPSAPVGEIGEPSVPEEVDLPEKEVVLDKEKAPQKGLASMLASIGMALGEISQSTLKTIFVILLLAILTLIIVKEGRRQFQKKRNK